MNPTLIRLDAEWRDLAGSTQSTDSLAQWQRHDPALGDGGGLDDLLARRRDPEAAPAILAGLARLAPTEPLAARVLLQALIPGLVRLAATACYDDPAALDELVSLAWERIRTYPVTRHGSVAANVLLDTRKRYRQHRVIEAPRNLSTDAMCTPPSTPSAESIAMGRSVMGDLATARRDGVIDEDSLDLIMRTRVVGESLDDLAADRECTVTCLAQRRWRAERRLRARLAPQAS